MEGQTLLTMPGASRVRLLGILLILIPSALSGCFGAVPNGVTVVGSTVTPEPFGSLSPTPFQPQVDTPASSPLAAFTPTVPASPVLSPTVTFTPLPPASPAVTFTPLPPISSLQQYSMAVRLDYTAHTLAVQESVQYRNPTSETLNGLVLAVESNRWAGCFNLESLTINGRLSTAFSLKGIRLEFALDAPLDPGQEVDLSLDYKLNLPVAGSQRVFGYNDSQTNLVDWYPFVVPFAEGQGWLLHEPAEVGEHLVYDTADFDVLIQFDGQSSQVTIAASAPFEQTSQGWHARLTHARTFALSASTDSLASTLTVGSVTITSTYFKEDKTAGQAVLQETAKALATFSERFGAYPYPSLNIVEAQFYDGLEQSGLFFLSRDFYTEYDGTLLNNLIDIGVHETAHQWWYSWVGNDQALEPWLDEALATYSEHVYYQVNYPQVTAWWMFRVDAYHPTGWVDTDIYHGSDFRTYTNAVYLRGAHFLEALRQRIGEVAFFAFLKDYAAQMAGKRATAGDFFRILRQHTGLDLSDIIHSYFQNQY